MTPAINVLVVEDEPLLRMNTAEQLQDRGFNVFEAANSLEALTVLAHTPSIHLLFTDVDMPGDMNGLELAGAVRSGWPNVGIIITSGNRQVSPSALPYNSRFFDKPYEPSTVANAIIQMVR